VTANLEKIIRNTEEKWLKPLFDACGRQFATMHLPSHDQWHHLRVWKYAKILMNHTVKKGLAISETDIERLIITVFFHDQGMSETLSKDHGKISRQICKTFFNQSAIEPPPNFELVLQAIENHDKKNYTEAVKTEIFDLQQFINLSDDLDALGIIGAYRYAEIYLLRKTNIQELPETVLINMMGRFQHFTKTFYNDKTFAKSQNQRFLSAHNFFKDLGFQLKQIEYSPESHLGAMGVINVIKNEIIKNKLSPLKACELVLNGNNDFYCHHFFERLGKELEGSFKI
jgi:hypothetical protein